MDRLRIAQNRFGLGVSVNDPVVANEGAWLERQFANYAVSVPGNYAGREALLKRFEGLRMERKQAERRFASEATPSQATQDEVQKRKDAILELVQGAYSEQAGARFRNAVVSQAPFIERLVAFWANHFAVSINRPNVWGVAGLLEFEAIRPHVLGRFEDMLIAVEKHPAMQLYLDQPRSVGPNSEIRKIPSWQKSGVGLNENLGREIMELHTLGARSGYTQADVTEFARALTGWSIAGFGLRGPGVPNFPEASFGQFRFEPGFHEPGIRTIMNTRYAQEGEAQARAALADFARHEATAEHIATKLARHFVSDQPPASLVGRLKKAFLDSSGDLPTVYRALYTSPEAWSEEPAKFRTPWLWSVAAYRALGYADAPQSRDRQPPPVLGDNYILRMFMRLGQPVWKPGSPAGFDDVAASWAAPEALVRRVELADSLAASANGALDPRTLANDLFGARLSQSTLETIARADSVSQGLALLLVSPEMLRS